MATSERAGPGAPEPTGRGRVLAGELTRIAVAAVVNAAGLLLAARFLGGLDISSDASAVLGGLAVSVSTAFVWPLLMRVALPLTSLTLGAATYVLDGLMLLAVLNVVPGIEVDGAGTAIVVAAVLALVATTVSAFSFVDDDRIVDRHMARYARQRRRDADVTDEPGVVYVQIDGLGIDVLRRAVRIGDVPNLARWLWSDTHRLHPWETEWSSQTGVSQAGILLGSTDDMPAFRWYEKADERLVVSNHPASAALIEQRHDNGDGLLADGGSSYGNLYTGGAERAILTMSGAGRRKEGRIGAGYGPYFSHPHNTMRTLVAVATDIVRERRAAHAQRRRDVRPRVKRSWSYSLLRSFTTVIMRDVCVYGVIGDIGEGRNAIYVDLLGYDEVAHHSGIERYDTMAVLRDIDRQVGRIERAIAWAPRPYDLVVLSDHGQSQGATFAERYGVTLEDVVRDRHDPAASPKVPTEVRGYLDAALAGVDGDGSGQGRLTASARERIDRAEQGTSKPQPGEGLMVLASGNLGLVYLTDVEGRATLEEIERRRPGLVDRLVAHPGVGFLLVRSERRGSLVIGARGVRELATDAVTGEDPLAPYGPWAPAQVRRADGFATVADLMVNSLVDPETGEVAAFEELVGSHGGLGGQQTQPFVLTPASWPDPTEPVFGAPALHRGLKTWRAAALRRPQASEITTSATAP
ncbi:MAG: phage holin family protein [Actinomycetota bacterium]|nr:phage holin family protein [Actinomycetota bacterium]